MKKCVHKLMSVNVIPKRFLVALGAVTMLHLHNFLKEISLPLPIHQERNTLPFYMFSLFSLKEKRIK